MPRQARIDAPGSLHHIIIRGIERKKIFGDDKDRDNFLERLGDITAETSTFCYAWSLIPNHAHLLLRTGSSPISTVMRRLLTGYAVSFNHRYGRHGKLFQNRYKSILCQEDPYFLELVRYIHLNPLRAKLVSDFNELNKYPYAGHSVILGKRKNEWQDVDFVLSFFAKRKGTARKRYLEYVSIGIEKGSRPDLVGGGFIRSLGGWAEVKKLQKDDLRQKADERILGDSDYVLEVLKQSQERFERKYELKAKGYSLDVLAERVAELFDIKLAEIYSPGKYKKIVQARSVFSYWAVRELGETATSIAKRIGISQPAVSMSVERGEKLIREMGLKLQLG